MSITLDVYATRFIILLIS